MLIADADRVSRCRTNDADSAADSPCSCPSSLGAPTRSLTAFPLSWIVGLFVGAVLAAGLVLRESSLAKAIMTPPAHLAGQVGIVAIAGLGLIALLNDIDALI